MDKHAIEREYVEIIRSDDPDIIRARLLARELPDASSARHDIQYVEQIRKTIREHKQAKAGAAVDIEQLRHELEQHRQGPLADARAKERDLERRIREASTNHKVADRLMEHLALYSSRIYPARAMANELAEVGIHIGSPPGGDDSRNAINHVTRPIRKLLNRGK